MNNDRDRVTKALAEHAPLLLDWLSSTDLNPESVERGRQVQRFIDAVRKGETLTTLQVVREEIRALTQELSKERDPKRVEALGAVLEKLNARYERLEKELLAEDG